MEFKKVKVASTALKASLNVERSVYLRIRDLARKNETTVSEVVGRLLDWALDEYEKQEVTENP